VLAVGLRAATLSGIARSGGTAVSALAKLEDLLPSRLRARVAAMGEDVVELAGPMGGGADPATLAVLALACRRGERVAIAYTDARGADSRRDLDPYRVVHAGRRWYLVARDVRRDAWRTFRIDRIGVAEPLGGRARFDDPPDAAAMVAEAITTSVYAVAATVRLDLPLDRARWLIPATVGQLDAEDGGTTRLRIGADDLDWLARYLVGLTCDLEVLEPPELTEALRALGRQLSTTSGRIERQPEAVRPTAVPPEPPDPATGAGSGG
jgi:predicted DNA-binding transcriptional regulator YafY